MSCTHPVMATKTCYFMQTEIHEGSTNYWEIFIMRGTPALCRLLNVFIGFSIHLRHVRLLELAKTQKNVTKFQTSALYFDTFQFHLMSLTTFDTEKNSDTLLSHDSRFQMYPRWFLHLFPPSVSTPPTQLLSSQ